MKFSTSFSSLLVVVLPLLLEAAALPNGFNGGFGGRNPSFGGAGGRFGGNQNQNQNQKGAGSQQQGKGNNNANNANNNANNANNTSSTASGANSTATAAASSSNNNNAANNNNNANNNANSDSNPQTSLTLDPSVIGQGFAQNGLSGNGTETGEVASLTSTNNFINFCIGQTITNGIQFTTSSCNPVPMGQLPAKNNLPSAKFTSPVNGQNIEPNTTFTVSMNIQGMETGNFVNADRNFLGAPQQVGQSGQVIGHSHIVIQAIKSFTDTTPADPTVFAYFKGLNEAAQNGVLSTTVSGGLAAGTYRVATINTGANHQPVLAPIAQHGSLDDAVYFTVGNAGQGQESTFGGSAGSAAGGAAAGAASGAAAGAASGAAAGGANNAAAGSANGAAAKGSNGGNGAAVKGANGANGAAKGANGAASKGANGAAAKGANGDKQQQQQQGKGRRSFTISRQN